MDGVDVEAFGLDAAYYLGALEEDLASGNYTPLPYRIVEVAKSGGGLRRLVIPAVRDRIVQAACAQLLMPWIEPCLHPCSYAYRRGVGVQDALAQVATYRDRGLRQVLRADIEAFFDTVNHAILFDLLDSAGVDGALSSLIRVWLETPLADGSSLDAPQVGLPQGLPVSPVLANLYLTPFDRGMIDEGWKLVRYADDFTVCCGTTEMLDDAVTCSQALLQPLKLRLNMNKTRRSSFEEGFSFLGALFQADEIIPATPHPYEADFTPPPERGPAPAPMLPRKVLRTLHVQQQGARLACHGGRLVVTKGAVTLLDLPAHHIDQIFLFGRVHVTSPAMAFCLRRGIPISLFSGRGDYRGVIQPIDSAEFRCERAQYGLLENEPKRLAASLAIVEAKGRHGRLLLETHLRNYPDPDLREITALLRDGLPHTAKSESLASLRGREGAMAATYFRGYARCFRGELRFTHRNHRPPRDPVNSLLSFGYTVLLRHVHAQLAAVGLDPHVGIFHESGRGHPALASDLLEEFRSPLIDRLVLTAANRSQFQPGDFYISGEGKKACLMHDETRGRFIARIEEALLETVPYPGLHHHVEWRQVLHLQASRMRRFILGEAKHYKPYQWKEKEH